jgi:hypothetical protein
MGKRPSPPPKSIVPLLPDDILHNVFSTLKFRDKINVGMVCKEWDQLLQAGTSGARHWVIEYDMDNVSSQALTMHATDGQMNAMGRCVTMPNRLIPMVVLWEKGNLLAAIVRTLQVCGCANIPLHSAYKAFQ